MWRIYVAFVALGNQPYSKSSCLTKMISNMSVFLERMSFTNVISIENTKEAFWWCAYLGHPVHKCWSFWRKLSQGLPICWGKPRCQRLLANQRLWNEKKFIKFLHSLTTLHTSICRRQSKPFQALLPEILRRLSKMSILQRALWGVFRRSTFWF